MSWNDGERGVVAGAGGGVGGDGDPVVKERSCVGGLVNQDVG